MGGRAFVALFLGTGLTLAFFSDEPLPADCASTRAAFVST
jgi:hypothetical protein